MKKFSCIAAAAALLLAGCGNTQGGGELPGGKQVAPDPKLQPFYTQKVKWGTCPDNVTDAPDMQCGTVKVPLNYENPSGETISLQAARLKRTPKKPRGALFMNPGGPGQSATDILVGISGASFSSSVMNNYIVVAVDPRGVGHSNPIRCLSDKQRDISRNGYVGTDLLADAKKEVETFMNGCLKNNPELAKTMDTQTHARDLDITRAAVGDTKLNYVGYSYGSMLGATYASLFPKTVGRMVLDGIVDPNRSADNMAKGQGLGFETATRHFLKTEQFEKGLSKNPNEALRQLQAFLESLDKKPLRTNQPTRPLTRALATEGIAALLYNTETYPTLRDALTQALDKHDGSQLLYFADTNSGRDSSGKYEENSADAIVLINNLDYQPEGDMELWKKQAAEINRLTPTYKDLFTYTDYMLAVSPLKGPKRQPVKFGALPHIVIVGNLHDPATPYDNAVSLHKQLPNSSLITLDSWNHCGYSGISTCVTKNVEKYLVDGVVPPKKVSCKVD